MLKNICLEHASNLDEDMATSVANLALAELTGAANNDASELLVSLSKHQCPQAVGSLIIK